eukprot:TRINITY_DN17278_c0_g1_i2.p5 TRINITY_DN17278_c0_g1~~TRINITY_DN17278_c0_g1_i2.p5  ORF type:complete len:116 (+),score=3.95 TRINITY_DN17278_c0_g1_i2:935-1282(+)
MSLQCHVSEQTSLYDTKFATNSINNSHEIHFESLQYLCEEYEILFVFQNEFVVNSPDFYQSYTNSYRIQYQQLFLSGQVTRNDILSGGSSIPNSDFFVRMFVTTMCVFGWQWIFA